MLAVVKVDIHAHRQHCHDQNVEQIFILADLRQPAGLGHLVNDTQLAGALGHLPYNGKGDQLRGHIIHHQRKQRVVGVPFCLENGGNYRPDGASRDAGGHHDEDQQPVGQHVAQIDHAGCGSQAADEHLTLAADVPEAHFERRGYCQRDAQQNGNVLTQDPQLARRAEGALQHGGVDGQWVFAREQHGNQRAGDQGQQDGSPADGPGTIPGQRLALGDVNQRNMVFLIHGLAPLPAGSSSCRPGFSPRCGRRECR